MKYASFIPLIGALAANLSFAATPEVILLDNELSPDQVSQRPYADYVRDCLDRLIEYGTDRYGDVHSPMLMNIIDVRSNECPADPLTLDEAFRVARRERRGPGGGNLYIDLPTLRAMYTVSRITGEGRYADFADECLRYYMNHHVDEKDFFWWGYHRHYDAHQDKEAGHMGNHHEIHFQMAIWPLLWKVNPQAVTREIEAIWQWHVIDKETGEINRHGNGDPGCDFAFTAGEFIYAFAFMHSKQPDDDWLKRAHLVADYYWDRRDKNTNLVATRPNAGPDRFDGTHADTSTAGIYCQRLLAASELVDDDKLRKQAVAYLQAYDRNAWDPDNENYFASLKLDGTPLPDTGVVTDEYLKYQPRGYVDLWQPYCGGYECPIRAAQTYAYAAGLTDNRQLKTAAQRWAKVIHKAWPPRSCDDNGWYAPYAEAYAPHGCYAEDYGQLISFFVRMHKLTGDDEHLAFAKTIADEAVSKLYYQGWFRGHPAKPYYESIDGVGYLLCGLVQLDEVIKGQPAALSQGNW